jgi:hypothetical protein
MKTCWESEVYLQFLTSVLDVFKWSASCPCHFTPRETANVTPCVGGCMDSRDGLHAAGYKKIVLPLAGIEPR